ncbi:MAG: EscU/YscU/HrcU family type III secretion system export apparatus switch protein [Paracoccaceae bacterium]
MSGQDDDTEKSHEPTQRKLDEARKKGDIARSQDLTTAAAYGGLLLAVVAAGPIIIEGIGNALMTLVSQSHDLAPLMFGGAPQPVFGAIMSAVGIAVLPLFALPAIAALLALFAQRGFAFAPSKLNFKLSRISIISNAKNKFGRGGLFEFGKSFTKLLIYSTVLGLFLRARIEEMAGTVQTSPGIATMMLADLFSRFFVVVLLIAITIGAIDFLWQKMEHNRKNMMSNKEIRDEHKESEGDPHMKNQRRQRGYEIAMGQMMKDVPDADVIIVNPTHYAVALKWSRMPGAAPVCVAKGVDEIAAKIREIANENAVPIRSDPPTARALYATTEIGQEITAEHYRAVAAAIRFAEAMRKRARWGR